MKDSLYFLGSSSPKGFVTPIRELLDNTENTVYILKGTAGCGKSTLMKRLAEAFPKSQKEIYLCSADPDSFDAVYFSDMKVLIMDGTAPHCFDPEYPKAVQSSVDLGAYLDNSLLRENKDSIIRLTDEYGDYHKRCRLCLAAISSVTEDIMSAANEALCTDKLTAYTARISKRLIPGRKDKHSDGKKLYRQLSAMTMNGAVTLTPEGYDIYIVDDTSTAASVRFLDGLTASSCAKGYDVIVSRCLICSEPFTEHILIPDLGIAFLSANCINSGDLPEGMKTLSLRRFYDKEALSASPSIKQRLRFGKKACTELIGEAASALCAAKKKHDLIEEYYIRSADFDSLDRLTYKLISDIKSLSH